MNPTAKKVAHFGLLVALSLVLGLMDRALPLSALLGGYIPGVKLGLANTVLVYAVFLMDWKSCFLLMLAKVVLSGLIFGSLSAILYSLAGGLLSLGVMLLVRHHPKAGALTAAAVSGFSAVLLFARHPQPAEGLFWCMIIIAAVFPASLALFLMLRRHPEGKVIVVSLCGAVAHNVGQVAAAALILQTPRLLSTYLPILAGIGAAVGWLTGIVSHRVLRALSKR